MAHCPSGPYRILSYFGSRDEPLVVLVLLVRLRAPSSHHDNRMVSRSTYGYSPQCAGYALDASATLIDNGCHRLKSLYDKDGHSPYFCHAFAPRSRGDLLSAYQFITPQPIEQFAIGVLGSAPNRL